MKETQRNQWEGKDDDSSGAICLHVHCNHDMVANVIKGHFRKQRHMMRLVAFSKSRLGHHASIRFCPPCV
jgi:hypothetical protein